MTDKVGVFPRTVRSDQCEARQGKAAQSSAKENTRLNRVGSSKGVT